MKDQTFNTLPPIQYDTNLATIAKFREKFMPLKITDLEDKDQFKVVHDARMVMVKVRTTIERERKSQKAAALQYGRDVDSAAKELFDASNPIEEHLQTEEDKVLNEQKRIKEEEAERERVKIQKRVDDLQQYGVVKPFAEVATCSDEEFAGMLSYSKDTFEAEQKAKAEEEARLAAEREELARKAEEHAKRDREQSEKEEELRAEREAFEREKREAQEKKDREEFERQAKERAEREAKEKIEREKREAEEREEAEKAEAARQEALKPDKEKLIAWAALIRNITPPAVSNGKAKTITSMGFDRLIDVADYIKEQAGEM
jgi:uncharacterized protein YhaN